MRDQFYIRGLDGLRFLGSVLVLFHHIERCKSVFGYDSGYMLTKGLGDTSMTFFFTLSGFLITYILLNEKKKSGTISLRNFYKKRVARIWPLYYLLVFSSILFFENSDLFAIPGIHEQTNYSVAIPLYLFQLPNFHVFFPASMLAALGHLWTIGVEEQFYAISPLIIKRVENFVKAFLIIVILKFIVTIAFTFIIQFSSLSLNQIDSLKIVKHFLHNLRFETFAIGGITAYIFLENKMRILEFVNRPLVKYLNLFFLLLTMWFGNKFDTFHILYAMSFSIIIVNLATKKEPVFFLDNTYIKYLGKISYGIYMFQIPVLYVVSNVLRPYYLTTNLVVWNLGYYIACIVFSIGISILSYEFMERKLIALSKK